MTRVTTTLSMLEGVRPDDFGLAGYKEYRKDPLNGREVQLEVVEFAAYCERRFACASAPVGIGKMLIAITLAKLLQVRTCIVVPYKGLQEQYTNELAGHLEDIRGRTNYDCGDYADLDCRSGMTMGCRYTSGRGCAYERAVARARASDVIVTNYDYWLAKNDKGMGLEQRDDDGEKVNPFELLVLDEGDEAETKVSEYLACRVYDNEIKKWVDPRMMGDSIETWKKFVAEHMQDVKEEARTAGMELAHLGRKATKEQVGVLHRIEKLYEKFQRIASIEDDWVLEERIGTKWGRMWCFDVVWPGRYTEQYLFRSVPKVVIMSGTLTKKDLSWLGISQDKYEYRQWESIFPKQKQPVYLCPPRKVNAEGKSVSVRIDKHTNAEDKMAWVDWMDEFISARLDRKGLILTTSYEYQRFILDHSKYADIMVRNTDEPDSETAAEIADKFYEMAAPRILVSPSFGRGWNFMYKRAEYVIIPKCPFVPVYGKVMQARLEKDKWYADLLCMKKIEQGNGRAKRAWDDQAECVLMDGHFEYFLYKGKHLAQEWFVNSVRKVVELPKPLERLR